MLGMSTSASRYNWYLCGTKDDPVVILGTTGTFFLLPAETDGHRSKAVVHAKEILVVCK